MGTPYPLPTLSTNKSTIATDQGAGGVWWVNKGVGVSKALGLTIMAFETPLRCDEMHQPRHRGAVEGIGRPRVSNVP